MTRMTAKDAGDLIFDEWVRAGTNGMSQTETRSALDLSRRQFTRGKEYLRDKLCVDKKEPFSYDPRENVYRLNADAAQVEEYYSYRLNVTMKQLRRLVDGTTIPAREKFKNNRKFVRFQRHLDNVIEDLKDLLAEIDA